MTKRVQTIKVKDYGDVWVNRLAAACQIIAAMTDHRERAAFFDWCHSTWPGDFQRPRP